MYIQQFLPLVTLSIVAAFTPGPNNILLMNTGLNYGIRRGIPHTLGVVFGFLILLLISLLGMSYVIEKFPIIKIIIKICGSLYLLYLAYKLLPSKDKTKDKTGSKNDYKTTATKNKNKSKIGFLNAFMFQIINPKGVTMIFILPGIVPVDTIVEKIIFMSLMFCITTSSAFTWLLGGKLLQTVINNPKKMYIMNVASSLALVATVIILYI